MNRVAGADPLFRRTDEPWTTRYENLRRRVVEEPFSSPDSWERALVVGRGLVAWMKAWPAHEPAPAKPTSEPASNHEVSIPAPLRRQFVLGLVNMILNAQQELSA